MSNLVGRYVPPTVTERRNAVKVAHPPGGPCVSNARRGTRYAVQVAYRTLRS